MFHSSPFKIAPPTNNIFRNKHKHFYTSETSSSVMYILCTPCISRIYSCTCLNSQNHYTTFWNNVTERPPICITSSVKHHQKLFSDKELFATIFHFYSRVQIRANSNKCQQETKISLNVQFPGLLGGRSQGKSQHRRASLSSNSSNHPTATWKY